MCLQWPGTFAFLHNDITISIRRINKITLWYDIAIVIIAGSLESAN